MNFQREPSYGGFPFFGPHGLEKTFDTHIIQLMGNSPLAKGWRKRVKYNYEKDFNCGSGG